MGLTYECDGSHEEAEERREAAVVLRICKDPKCAAIEAECAHAEPVFEPRTRRRFLRTCLAYSDDRRQQFCTYCGKITG